MKQLTVLLLTGALLLTGCGSSGVSQEEYNKVVAERDALLKQVSESNNPTEKTIAEKEENEPVSKNETQNDNQKTENTEGTIPEDNSSGGVEILAEYTLTDNIGWYTRHFIVIKNNTGDTVDVSTSSLAFDKDGTLIGADDANFDALGAGCTSVIYEAFEVESEIDRYETELNFSKTKYYKSVIQDLSYTQNDVERGAIFQVTNNGEDAAKFVEGFALFFQNGELVEYDSTYFTDDDSEIKAGKTISKQITAYKDFDTIEFYLTGRK